MSKTALIFGITGMDGSYLAELLLELGYEVHGVIRRASTFNTERIDRFIDKLHLHYGDLDDGNSIEKIIREVKPLEIYNLGAQSQVRVSFDIPIYTGSVTGLGVLRVLEAVRNVDSTIKIYQASSSEMFGRVLENPQRETTPFNPRSPYGCAKVYAHQICLMYREAYGMNIRTGILFNHESPRRGETFVTRKIAIAAVKIKMGLQKKLELGNLEACRDWGWTPDFVEGIYKIMQYKEPDDFILATGETHSVQEFAEEAFRYVGLDWKDYVVINPRLVRPAEVDLLLGDYSKANKLLDWQPTMKFKDIVGAMVQAELDRYGY